MATSSEQFLVEFGPHVLAFPTTWAGVSLGQFLDLIAAPETSLETPRHVLTVLCSHPELLGQIPDPTADVQILTALPFLRSLPDFRALPCPVSLTVEGRVVPLPGNLRIETLGQKLAADAETEGLQPTDFITPALALLAIYFWPTLTDTPFTDLSDYETLYPRLRGIPVTEALPVAAFFLSSYRHLMPSGRVIYRHRVGTRPGRRLRDWWKNFRRMLPMS